MSYPVCRRDLDLVARPNGRPMLLMKGPRVPEEDYLSARLFLDFDRNSIKGYFKHYESENNEERIVSIVEVDAVEWSLSMPLTEGIYVDFLVLNDSKDPASYGTEDIQNFMACVRRVGQ
jgi:hypothetical protein